MRTPMPIVAIAYFVRDEGLETYSFSTLIGFFVRSETPKNTQSGFKSLTEASPRFLSLTLCAMRDLKLTVSVP